MHTVQLVCFFVPYIQGLSKEYISLPLLSVWKGQWYVSACVLLLNHVKYTTIMYLVVPIHLFHPSSSSISCIFKQQKKLISDVRHIFPPLHLPKSILWFIYIQRAYCDTSSFLYLIWKWCVPEFLLYLFLSTFPSDDDGGTMFFSLNLPPNLVSSFYVSFKGQLNSEWIYEVIVSPKMPLPKITKISALKVDYRVGQKSW